MHDQWHFQLIPANRCHTFPWSNRQLIYTLFQKLRYSRNNILFALLIGKGHLWISLFSFFCFLITCIATVSLLHVLRLIFKINIIFVHSLYGCTINKHDPLNSQISCKFVYLHHHFQCATKVPKIFYYLFTTIWFFFLIFVSCIQSNVLQLIFFCLFLWFSFLW